jgi:hypothetical protein
LALVSPRFGNFPAGGKLHGGCQNFAHIIDIFVQVQGSGEAGVGNHLAVVFALGKADKENGFMFSSLVGL